MRSLFRAVVFGVLLATAIAAGIAFLTPTGDRISAGGSHGSLRVEGSSGEYVWLTVSFREEVLADRFGATGWLNAVAGPERKVDQSDLAESEWDAWMAADLLAQVGVCDGFTSCSSRPPAWNFPRHMTGRSAGLTLMLASLDVLTPGDLSAGLVIASTGVIASNLPSTYIPQVLAVSGVDVKLGQAIEAGADVLFIPEDAMEQIAGLDTGGVEVVPLMDGAEALEWLCARGSEPACSVLEPLALEPENGYVRFFPSGW